MVEYDEKGKLVIPEKETQSTESQPIEVGDTTEALTKLLDKKEKTKTQPKKSSKQKSKGTKDHPAYNEPGYWKYYYQKNKSKYKFWNTRWRKRKQEETKKLKEQQENKITKKTTTKKQ